MIKLKPGMLVRWNSNGINNGDLGIILKISEQDGEKLAKIRWIYEKESQCHGPVVYPVSRFFEGSKTISVLNE